MDIQEAESSAAKDEQEAEEVSTLAAAIGGHLEDAAPSSRKRERSSSRKRRKSRSASAESRPRKKKKKDATRKRRCASAPETEGLESAEGIKEPQSDEAENAGETEGLQHDADAVTAEVTRAPGGEENAMGAEEIEGIDALNADKMEEANAIDTEEAEGLQGEANADTKESEEASEPALLQFFVKALCGETIVLREPMDTKVREVKGILLTKLTQGVCETMPDVFLTCEGKPLDDDLSLGEVPVEEGSTLHMCVRFQSTMYKGASQDAIKLQELVSLFIRFEAPRTDALGGSRRHLLRSILEQLHSFLQPPYEEWDRFKPAAYAAAFVSGGGVEAITSLLCSGSGFLAYSCIQLICDPIVKLGEEDPLRRTALHVGWHLLESLLDNPYAAKADALEQCLNGLSVLVCFCGPSDAEVFGTLGRRGKRSWGRKFVELFTRLGRKLRVQVEQDVLRFATGGELEARPAGAFQYLPNILQYLNVFPVPDPEEPYYDKSVRRIFKQLKYALHFLLGDAIQTAVDRETATQTVESATSADQEFSAAFPPLSASLEQLPPHLLTHLTACLEAVVQLASDKTKLQRKLREFLGARVRTVSGLLLLHTDDFHGMRELRQVFERPYRDLWPVELKQRWLEENLPVFCPVAAYQVAVRRGDNLLTDAFNQIASADPGDLRQGISVTFQEEEGYGPGVTREFFTLVSQKLFNPEFALFRTSPSDRRRVFPTHNSVFNSSHLAYFRFCGRIIALALAHKVQLGVTFCSALLDAMWGRVYSLSSWETAGHEAARDIDPELFESCEKLLEMPEEEFKELGLTYVCVRESLGAHAELELFRGGRREEVRYEDRAAFVKMKVQKQLMEPVEEQIAAIREGMEAILTNGDYKWPDVFGVLMEEEFTSLVQGAPTELSVDDWEAHTAYHGYSAKDRVIRRFWRVVRSLSPEQQRRLLFFATAVRHLPATGFAGLPEKFHIHCAETGCDSLPTSHTCYFQLMLPKYASTRMMKERLLMITQEHVAEGFGEV